MLQVNKVYKMAKIDVLNLGRLVGQYLIKRLVKIWKITFKTH